MGNASAAQEKAYDASLPSMLSYVDILVGSVGGDAGAVGVEPELGRLVHSELGRCDGDDGDLLFATSRCWIAVTSAAIYNLHLKSEACTVVLLMGSDCTWLAQTLQPVGMYLPLCT